MERNGFGTRNSSNCDGVQPECTQQWGRIKQNYLEDLRQQVVGNQGHIGSAGGWEPLIWVVGIGVRYSPA